MSQHSRKYIQFSVAISVIVLAIGYLGFTGVQETKSYYKTIKELGKMGSKAQSLRLRVSGKVQPGSIRRRGTYVEFNLTEEAQVLPVEYQGTEAPPDTFKDNSQALVEGKYGRDGVFHAQKLQAKCASKYAPQQKRSWPSAISEKADVSSQSW